MNGARRVLWVLAPIALISLAFVTASQPQTTYGGADRWLLGLEVLASAALVISAAELEEDRTAWLPLGLIGVGWLVPELTGWVTGPGVLRILTGAWGQALPAMALLAVATARSAAPLAARMLAGAGGLLVAASHVLWFDPFLDTRCWRWCDHNPLALPGSHQTAGVGAEVFGLFLVVTAIGIWLMVGLRASTSSTTAGRLRLAAETTMLAALVAPAAGRLVAVESPSSGPFLGAFVLAQLGATVAVGVAATERFRRWSLARRIARLAGRLTEIAGPESLEALLRNAVTDDRLELHYWSATRDRFVDSQGTVHPAEVAGDRKVTCVRRGGQQVARVVHSSSVDGEQLERAFGPALRLVLENEQLRVAAAVDLQELETSRARVVERSDTERRRLERNLHDGAQQRVVSLALLVRMIAARAAGDLAPFGDEAATVVGVIVDELRRVARGIYPAVLVDAGLAGAVTELAVASAGMPIIVDGLPKERLAGTVETTAYLMIATAISDARHRGANEVFVDGHLDSQVLRCVVHDDAAAGDAPGAVEMEDRIRALGGRLVQDLLDHGYRITMELPCG